MQFCNFLSLVDVLSTSHFFSFLPRGLDFLADVCCYEQWIFCWVMGKYMSTFALYICLFSGIQPSTQISEISVS